ncbi:unnamed protein product [Adineta steineri]|uniref:Uncharacterized protein n=1 Tax=Adineta steineri TaxID=433720 RepID=A0A814VNW6_9BILA|nr:unnamed protein product [Adineta steineri]
MISNGGLDGDLYGISPFQQGRTFMTPPRNPPIYYNNSSYSQPSMMTRDGPITNNVSGANNNNANAYLTDLHSHSVQSKYSHPNPMMGSSRLAHLGVNGTFNNLGSVSSHGKYLLDFVT